MCFFINSILLLSPLLLLEKMLYRQPIGITHLRVILIPRGQFIENQLWKFLANISQSISYRFSHILTRIGLMLTQKNDSLQRVFLEIGPRGPYPQPLGNSPNHIRVTIGQPFGNKRQCSFIPSLFTNKIKRLGQHLLHTPILITAYPLFQKTQGLFILHPYIPQ